MSDTLTTDTSPTPATPTGDPIGEHAATARTHLAAARAGDQAAAVDLQVDTALLLGDIDRLTERLVAASASRAHTHRLAVDLLAAVRAALATGQACALVTVLDHYQLPHPDPVQPTLTGVLTVLAQHHRLPAPAVSTGE